jgi:hypothetical protein
VSRVLIALFLIASVSAAEGESPEANYVRAEKPLCAFHYTEKLETRALSVLQLELGSKGARFYDASNPVVTICHKKATLMFGGTLMPEGHHLLDPPHVYIDVDVCSHHILAVDHDDGMTVRDQSPCA